MAGNHNDYTDMDLEGYSVPTIRPGECEYLESLRLLRPHNIGFTNRMHKGVSDTTHLAALEGFRLFSNKDLIKNLITVPCMVVSFDTLCWLHLGLETRNRLWTAWLSRRERTLKRDPYFEPDPYDEGEMLNDKPIREFRDLIVSYSEHQPEREWQLFVKACGVEEVPLKKWLEESGPPGFDRADEHPFDVRKSWVHEFVCSRFHELEMIRNTSLERWTKLKRARKLDRFIEMDDND
ncbi:hypothetical protein QBC40DRAFT_292381 [Triangularia verruculosa]|uniref:Uncharacterized protein n=1 Tax=Triangularia verruculosa TaxID=2587418 RepID=A0AAN7AZ14_9PEZI|nr:hypothetical protein QBC40DRAFT_292381 [Triangularia verruculosa]